MNPPPAPAPPAEGGARLDAVLFHAGGFRWGLEASKVAALLPAQGGREALALETLLGFPPPPASAGRRHLLLRLKEDEFPLEVDGPLELRPLWAEAIHPLPPLLAARLALPALRAVHLDGDQLVLLLDAERLRGRESPLQNGELPLSFGNE